MYFLILSSIESLPSCSNNKIENKVKSGMVKKGLEKGYFKYGGSTIVLLFEKNKIALDEEIINNSLNGLETYVKYGEKIGEKKK